MGKDPSHVDFRKIREISTVSFYDKRCLFELFRTGLLQNLELLLFCDEQEPIDMICVLTVRKITFLGLVFRLSLENRKRSGCN